MNKVILKKRTHLPNISLATDYHRVRPRFLHSNMTTFLYYTLQAREILDREKEYMIQGRVGLLGLNISTSNTVNI